MLRHPPTKVAGNGRAPPAVPGKQRYSGPSQRSQRSVVAHGGGPRGAKRRLSDLPLPGRGGDFAGTTCPQMAPDATTATQSPPIANQPNSLQQHLPRCLGTVAYSSSLQPSQPSIAFFFLPRPSSFTFAFTFLLLAPFGPPLSALLLLLPLSLRLFSLFFIFFFYLLSSASLAPAEAAKGFVIRLHHSLRTYTATSTTSFRHHHHHHHLPLRQRNYILSSQRHAQPSR